MYFKKHHHPVNFVGPQRIARDGRLRFGGRVVDLAITAFGDDVFRFEAGGPGWERNRSLAQLTPPRGDAGGCALAIVDDRLVLRSGDGEALLTGRARRPLAVSGDSWLIEFEPERALRYFGLGEKHLGWEKRQLRTKFWNTDAWGDFDMKSIETATYDPAYASIPYLAIKRGDTWIGVLIDCPDAPFLSLPNFDEGKKNTFFAPAGPSFFVGAESGRPSVWFIVGPTLAELTRKLQRLCGTTPLPPLWALGHHQCRWGYGDADDLREVERGFARHRIPNDGLWLDIDYMERFKVFTWNAKRWSGRGRVRRELAGFADRGHAVVPILDPGVKVERGYAAYESGLAAGAFCLTREGIPYTGLVWPGETAFPDFATETGRRWWADRVARFAADGVGGAWIDMNDPSVGPAELTDMRFERGARPHGDYHNQYALGMAMATRAGFLAAAPDRRPFVLSRSGWIGMARHAALWTGDNIANWTHLRGSIACSMALAISGLPFNGPDVPGFAGDPSTELAVAWYKAGFLFPFLRNHSITGGRRREPWAFGARPTRVIGDCIRLRYRLLPYLYNLWIDQEERGEAVMRPLCYDFADAPGQDLAAVGDQFLCGPALLHAPVLEEGKNRRTVVLPPGAWLGLHDGRWVAGGRTVTARQDAASTPLYARAGSLVAMQVGERTTNRNDLAAIELHCFLRPGGEGACTYRWDDGATFAYRDGARSAVDLRARLRGRRLELDVVRGATGSGGLTLTVVVHAACEEVVLRADGVERVLAARAARWSPFGRARPCARTAAVRVGAGRAPRRAARGRR